MRTKPILNLTLTKDVEVYREKRISFAVYEANFWEVVLPIVGSVEFSTEGRKRMLSHGTIAFIAPHVKRRLTLRGDDGEYLSIRVRPETVKQVMDAFEYQSYIEFSKMEVYVKDIDEIHIRDFNVAVQAVHIAVDADRETAIKKLIYTIFMPLIPFRDYNGGADVTQRALTVMNDPRNVALRLPDVAKKVGCSEEYLVRCFKKNGLETPNTIFKHIKLRYAKSLLTTQKISVSEVATLIGFRSVGHFNKLYNSEYGVCPGADKSR